MSSAAFWDRAARKYATSPIRNVDAYEAGLARVRAHLSPEDHALEVGCGTGSTALLLAPSVAQYIGSDISAEMIAIANEKIADGSAPNVTFRQSTVAMAPDGQTFDVILAFNLLHLLPDPAGDIARLRDGLRPGGLLITKTPCLTGIKTLLWPVIGAMRLVGKAPYVRFLSEGRIERMMTEAGFEIVETGDYPAGSHFVVARKA